MLRIPIALSALACGCGSSDNEPEPLATRSSGPIVFTRGDALIAVDPRSANERVVSTKVRPGSLSPDRKRVAYTLEVPYRDGHPSYMVVYVANADGSAPRKLRRAGPNTGDPVWSPRGDELIVDDNDDGIHAMWVVDVGGSGARRLPTARYAGSPAWSPDGTKIAYEDGGWIYVMSPDGSAQRRVTRGGSVDWTPSGQLTFGSDQEEIWVVNADGTGRRRVVRLGGDPWGIDFSPDGRRVAYSAWIERDTELYVAEVATGTVTRLTENEMHDSWPAWSPDGKSLAFTRFEPSTKTYAYDWGPADVWVMNADGTGERNLTNTEADEGDPEWLGPTR